MEDHVPDMQAGGAGSTGHTPRSLEGRVGSEEMSRSGNCVAALASEAQPG